MLRLPALYPILDFATEPARAEMAAAGTLARDLCAAGATTMQLRCKVAGGRAMLHLARDLVSMLEPLGGQLIVNDRLDLALLAGAAGVHLGQDDLPLRSARAIAPPGFLIGLSTHDPDEAARAEAEGADYIGFGPMAATGSKSNALAAPRSLAQLAATRTRVKIPIVAIGGIDLPRVPEILDAGADAVAMIGALARADDPPALVRAVLALRPRSRRTPRASSPLRPHRG